MASQDQQQQAYFPPMPDYRRRSSSKTDRYRPSSYSNAPPHQPDPNLLGPQQYPMSPAIVVPPPAPPQQQQPPYPVDYPMGGSPYMEVPNMAQHQLAGEMGSRRPSTTMYPDGLQRPSYDGSQSRRPSYGSRHSHRSERSHRSHHSARSRYEEDELGDDDDDLGHHHKHHGHHHHHHHHKENDDDLDAYRRRVKDRGDNVSRSWGNSLVSFFGPLKYLLEPRDKY